MGTICKKIKKKKKFVKKQKIYYNKGEMNIMKEEDLTNITNSIKEKLGEESTALIADDLGILITKNSEVLESIHNQETMISTLEEKNGKLVSANQSLLQQVPIGTKQVEQPKVESSETKSFNFNSMFDKNGNFKHDL